VPSEGVEPFTDGLSGFVDAVPKVELHVHLEGSIALPTLLELIRTQPDSMLPRSEEGCSRCTASATSRISSRSICSSAGTSEARRTLR
jgi:hypothetical protein